MRLLCLVPVAAATLWADGAGVILSRHAKADFAVTADPRAPVWASAQPVFAERSAAGEPAPGHRTTIRSVWTPDYLYFHFTCPYEQLYLKGNASKTAETNKLWEWDVAEVFVGWDPQNFHQYKEFQVSPQGEWVDLDIDRKNPKPNAWEWNSGFTVDARIDEKNKVWYGAMKIPMKSIDPRPAAEGNELRINFYRIQGPPPNRKYVAWQPTGARSHHVPESFGRLRLVK